jgi:hypothetical protein
VPVEVRNSTAAPLSQAPPPTSRTSGGFEGGVYDIYAVDWVSSGHVRLTRNRGKGAEVREPDWSSEGTLGPESETATSLASPDTRSGSSA